MYKGIQFELQLIHLSRLTPGGTLLEKLLIQPIFVLAFIPTITYSNNAIQLGYVFLQTDRVLLVRTFIATKVAPGSLTQ